MKRVDVLALVAGLLLTGIAAGSLWLALGGTLDWHLVGIAAPLILVGVGVLGLALSRHRT